MSDIFQRTRIIYKDIDKIKDKNIIVFGVGGVGGFAVEALVRCGIENITIVDFDTIDITNINRQIIALHSTVGRKKVDVLKERIIDINPNAKVKTICEKLSPENILKFNLLEYDYILDCIDSVLSKIELIQYAKNNKLNIISAMGAGGHIDPLKIKVCDISKTRNCKLARVIRLELKKRKIKRVKCVFVDETVVSKATELKDIRKSYQGTLSFMPSAMGLIMAKEVIVDIMKDIENDI